MMQLGPTSPSQGSSCHAPALSQVSRLGNLKILRLFELASQAEEIEAWDGLPPSIKEEVGSPYAFLCENARYLVVPQAMRGHPKLWHVQGNIVKGVSAALKPAKAIGAQPFTWDQVRPRKQ